MQNISINPKIPSIMINLLKNGTPVAHIIETLHDFEMTTVKSASKQTRKRVF